MLCNKNRSICARAPLRLGLAGGGSDVSPYCDEFGGCVLNVTIDMYAYSVLRLRNDNKIFFESDDLDVGIEYNFNHPQQFPKELLLHKATYHKIMQKYNSGQYIPLSIITHCDAPPGSGLGSSSTIVVAMVKAFAELLNLSLDDYQIANLAFEIERIDCGLKGGRQDQYTAAFGGFNFMEFYAENRAVINQLRIKNWIICELESSILLYYSGVSRESDKIINEQSASISQRSGKSLEAMHNVKKEAVWMKECLFKSDFQGIVESMRMGWENKKLTSSSISSGLIENIFDAAIGAGALSGKVSGAGGGGFTLFFVPIEKRMKVIRALKPFRGELRNAHFTKHGAQAWRI